MIQGYKKWYGLLAAVIISLDRWTKYIVIQNVPYYRMSQFACIDLVYNRGISFGMLHSDNMIMFLAINLLIGLVLSMLALHAYHRLCDKKLIVGEICIFAGAISNVVDRYVHGGVVDFIALSYADWHFAVFNVADIFIFCGVTLMFILEYKESWQKF